MTDHTPEAIAQLVRQLNADAASDERNGIPGAFFERRIATLRAAASALSALAAERDALVKVRDQMAKQDVRQQERLAAAEAERETLAVAAYAFLLDYGDKRPWESPREDTQRTSKRHRLTGLLMKVGNDEFFRAAIAPEPKREPK